MRKLSISKFIASSALSIAVGAFSLIASPVVVSIEAQAGNAGKGVQARRSAGRSGFAGKRVQGFSGNRSNLRSQNVINGGKNLRVLQRDRQINIRNEQVQRRNELRLLQSTTRRSRPAGRFLSGQERGALIGESLIGTGSITSNSGVSECPSQHNCGFRIYSNGSGPRIITPGIGSGKGLPKFDGVNGSSVIVLD